MRSTQRILTTHTGSLPRPDGLNELLLALLADEPGVPNRTVLPAELVVRRSTRPPA